MDFYYPRDESRLSQQLMELILYKRDIAREIMRFRVDRVVCGRWFR
jgi:hypothetical protein